jgi:4-diphosphocytidyl-2-C-methyl-D-erythritol kinase
VEIEIRKKIPVAAGLGGGSSNAATTLVVLNELFALGVPPGELMLLGSRLGADVPFFIQGKTAWATGIGDLLTPASPLPPFWLVLINPGFAVATADVYGKLNLGLTSKTANYSIPPFYTSEELASLLANDLEVVTAGLFPVITLMKQRLLAAGAMGSIMSGSGPTVFGIFASEEKARRGVGKIAKEADPAWKIYLTSPLAG